MRKWCPELLDPTREQPRPQATTVRPFAADSPVFEKSTETPAGQKAGFEQDLSLTGGHSLWELMNQDERDRLLGEVRATLQEEFELRERELRQRQCEELEGAKAEYFQRLENWSLEMNAHLAAEKQERAVEATGLALAVARKIIRDQVEVDRALWTRSVETALFKVSDAHPLTVVLHPDDENFLKDHPELMSRLGIGQVVPDRRVEKGGCRIRAGVREWDATLDGQLKAMAGVLAETLAETEARKPCPEGKGDPGVD